MYLFYTLGGGLGHLTRVLAFINTQCMDSSQCVILSSQEIAHAIFPDSPCIILPNHLKDSPKKLFEAIMEIIVFHKIRIVFMDTFPNGIIGEWSFLQNHKFEINYIARLLNWNNYKPLTEGHKINFQKTYIIEPLSEPHNNFITQHSKSVQTFTIDYPKVPEDKEIVQKLLSIRKPMWLIAHSYPVDEVLQLYDYAQDLAKVQNKNYSFVIISSSPIEGISSQVLQLNIFPAYPFFIYADRIFTGCGFNSMKQTETIKEKHSFIPFPRRFDDQFQRASIRRYSMN